MKFIQYLLLVILLIGCKKDNPEHPLPEVSPSPTNLKSMNLEDTKFLIMAWDTLYRYTNDHTLEKVEYTYMYTHMNDEVRRSENYIDEPIYYMYDINTDYFTVTFDYYPYFIVDKKTGAVHRLGVPYTHGLDYEWGILLHWRPLIINDKIYFSGTPIRDWNDTTANSEWELMSIDCSSDDFTSTIHYCINNREDITSIIPDKFGNIYFWDWAQSKTGVHNLNNEIQYYEFTEAMNFFKGHDDYMYSFSGNSTNPTISRYTHYPMALLKGML